MKQEDSFNRNDVFSEHNPNDTNEGVIDCLKDYFTLKEIEAVTKEAQLPFKM